MVNFKIMVDLEKRSIAVAAIPMMAIIEDLNSAKTHSNYSQVNERVKNEITWLVFLGTDIPIPLGWIWIQ